jgi:hypothetical protein
MSTKLAPTLVAAAAAAAALAAAASATAPPVGPLPSGPTTTVTARRGSLVAVALRRQKPATGLVWRLARRLDPGILRQVAEADVGESVVVVFRATGAGSVRIAFALTRGESGSTALRAAFYSVRVT